MKPRGLYRHLSLIVLQLSTFFVFCPAFYAQELTVDNTAKYVGKGRYEWTVFILAGDSVLNSIRYVEYTLHPTFPNPVRNGTGRTFALSSNGWGEFNIKVRIVYKDKDREPSRINYWLQLFEKSKK